MEKGQASVLLRSNATVKGGFSNSRKLLKEAHGAMDAGNTVIHRILLARLGC